MKKLISMILVFAFTFSGVLFAADPATSRDKTKKGAVIGAVAGGVLGAIIGNNRGSGNAKRGTIVGAVAGTAIGAGIGAYMDKQERELRQIEGIDVTRTSDDELNVVMRNEVLFDFDSSALRSSSRDSLSQMAEVFQKYGDTTLSVEGHTDSVGSESYNDSLSKRRANSVAWYLEDLGVRGSRMEIVGYGETQPRSSNSTASGRQQNRRVEIHVRAN